MTSRTEQALSALFGFLAAAALPTVTRNEALDVALDALQAGAAGHANLIDGQGSVTAVQLGGVRVYEIAHIAEVEWIVQAADAGDREALFDGGLEAIADAVDAVNAAVEDGSPAVAGIVDDAEILSVDRSNLAIDGTPQLKGAIIQVRLTFTSPRPF